MPDPNGYGFAIHNDKNKCDYCGDEATMHFLSRGYSHELEKLEWWQHHLDLCLFCYNKRK